MLHDNVRYMRTMGEGHAGVTSSDSRVPWFVYFYSFFQDPFSLGAGRVVRRTTKNNFRALLRNSLTLGSLFLPEIANITTNVIMALTLGYAPSFSPIILSCEKNVQSEVDQLLLRLLSPYDSVLFSGIRPLPTTPKILGFGLLLLAIFRQDAQLLPRLLQKMGLHYVETLHFLGHVG